MAFEPDERSEYLDDCSALSTDKMEDLLLPSIPSSPDEAFDKIDEHGVAIIPKILSQTTAQQLRDFVIEEANPSMQQVFVLKNKNRSRVMPTPFEHEVVSQAMKEIALHPTVKPLLDDVLGPHASLIAFSVITSSYGAKAQHWHRDTTKSPMTHENKFVHELTLTIPLQDTTPEMGATGICPGTHRCHWIEGYKMKTSKKGGLPCNITASLEQGDGLIYHTDTLHRGGAHVDPNALDRSVLFVSFAESKEGRNDQRRLAYGKVYSLDWRMWGITIDDFPYLRNWSWRWSFLHPLGFRSFTSTDNSTTKNKKEKESITIRPWNAVDAFFHIFNRPGDKCHFLFSDPFDAQQTEQWSGTMMYWTVSLFFTYLWIGVPLWILVVIPYYFQKKNNVTPQLP